MRDGDDLWYGASQETYYIFPPPLLFIEINLITRLQINIDSFNLETCSYDTPITLSLFYVSDWL